MTSLHVYCKRHVVERFVVEVDKKGVGASDLSGIGLIDEKDKYSILLTGDHVKSGGDSVIIFCEHMKMEHKKHEIVSPVLHEGCDEMWVLKIRCSLCDEIERVLKVLPSADQVYFHYVEDMTEPIRVDTTPPSPQHLVGSGDDIVLPNSSRVSVSAFYVCMAMANVYL